MTIYFAIEMAIFRRARLLLNVLSDLNLQLEKIYFIGYTEVFQNYEKNIENGIFQRA